MYQVENGASPQMNTSSRSRDDEGHLRCPFCDAYEVERLYLGSLHADSCTCLSCGARWDEDAETGRYRGRGTVDSVIAPRQR
jgi:hypothetical protein